MQGPKTMFDFVLMTSLLATAIIANAPYLM